MRKIVTADVAQELANLNQEGKLHSLSIELKKVKKQTKIEANYEVGEPDLSAPESDRNFLTETLETLAIALEQGYKINNVTIHKQGQDLFVQYVRGEKVSG